MQRHPESPRGRRGGGERRRLVGSTLTFVLALSLGLAGSAPLLAQGAGVAGTVVEARTNRPLVGAQVAVTGTQRGTLSDANGRFVIPDLGSAEATLNVVMLGYRPANVTVRAGQNDVRVALEETAVALDQLVVTGQVGGTQRRAVGNSIAQIKAADVAATQPVHSVQELINGRAPGVVVTPGTGMVGSGSRIRIRGYSTFSLTPDPLIYVDGIRVNNDAQSGFAMQAFGSSVVSRLNDFDPDQIESIEILKGPAAATLYGTEAARGVINIITKKGAPGGTRYSFTMKQGANWFDNPQGRLPVNYWLNPATGNVESLNIYARDKAQGYEAFRTGGMQTYDFSVSGGAEKIRYYIATDIDHNQGAEPDNFKNATSGRVNVEIQPSEKLSITASSGYVSSRMGQSCESGCGGAMWEITFSNPANLPEFACAGSDDPSCGYALGYQSNSPRVDRQMRDWQKVGRYTGSVTANWRPFKFMTHRLTIGTDVTQEENTEYIPYLTDDTARYLWSPSVRDGYKYENRRQVNYNTFDYAGTANFDVRQGLNAATSVGLQYYQRHNQFVTAQGNGYAGPGLETIAAAATKPFATEDFDDNNTLGFYGQEQLGWRDRLFVTGALRVDNNSSFGNDIKWVTYPKASVSWVLNEEPSVRAKMPQFINTFKLRAAYGESGQQPPSFVALRTFSPATGPGDTPALTPNTLGNPELKPERGKEVEAGFDAGFLNDRLGLELTYYHTTTVDAILLRDIAPSTGFGGLNKQQYVNAGSIVNQGLEALLKAQVVNGRNFAWDMNFNLATNSGKVTKLNGADTTFVSGDIQWKIGYAPRAWFREKIVSADFDPTTKTAINVMCDNGAGGSTPCFNAAGQVIAPRVYLGRTVPAVEGSIGTNFRFFERFGLSGLLDFKTGFRKFDNNRRARCQIFHTCLENMYPERYDPKFIAAMNTNNTIKDWVIQDASFAKLREIALSYTVPESYVRSFGARSATVHVAARNLHTFSSWSGLDPEGSMLSGATLEQDNLPQLMSFVTTINLNF